jgi:hypothetical protein
VRPDSSTVPGLKIATKSTIEPEQKYEPSETSNKNRRRNEPVEESDNGVNPLSDSSEAYSQVSAELRMLEEAAIRSKPPMAQIPKLGHFVAPSVKAPPKMTSMTKVIELGIGKQAKLGGLGLNLQDLKK